jgi:hypothetical protein
MCDAIAVCATMICMMRQRAFVDSAAPVGVFCAHLLCYSGCTRRRLLRGVFWKKTSIFCTCCAIPAAPIGDFCAESSGKDFDFSHLLCYSGCTRRRLLRG